MFNPCDEQWWQGSEELNWWHSALAASPRWLPSMEESQQFLTANNHKLLQALTLIRSMRTVESSQLHEFNPLLPARPQSTLYLSMAAQRLIDMGFPARVDGKATSNPYTSGFTAFRLPRYKPIQRKQLLTYGLNPVEIMSIGNGPLSAARQADRHNLIAMNITVLAKQAGWLTAGEAWCRFDQITLDPLMGGGGPDAAFIGETGITFLELTASTNQGLEKKFQRWDRVLAYPGCERMHVLWLEAGRRDPGTIRNKLTNLCKERPRQHADTITDWTPNRITWMQPGTPVNPSGWVHDDLEQIGNMLGFDHAGSWRLPHRLEGEWVG